MTRIRMTRADYAAARALYDRHRDGDALEFEQEMDATLPAQMLLCQLDDAFAELAQQLDGIAAQFPEEFVIDPELEALLAAAYEEMQAVHFRFLKRFVALEPTPENPG